MSNRKHILQYHSPDIEEFLRFTSREHNKLENTNKASMIVQLDENLTNEEIRFNIRFTRHNYNTFEHYTPYR